MNDSCADWIFLRGLRASASVGLRDEPVLQSLEVDLEVLMDLKDAAASDSLADTFNYADLARMIHETLCERHHASLAAAATSIAEALLGCDEKVEEVRLTLRNPRVVLESSVDCIGISIVERRARMPVGDRRP